MKMKKATAILLTIITCLSLCSCQSKEERDLEAAKAKAAESKARAIEAQAKYDDVVGRVNEIEDMQNALGLGK